MMNGSFRLLEKFRRAFFGVKYKHRSSTVGNKIGRELFEDLFVHKVSSRYNQTVQAATVVVNGGGKVHGKLIRRNDSVFGVPPAGVLPPQAPSGFSVHEAPVAEPRIACEVKIIAKSQLKQIDRVVSDLRDFATRMKSLNSYCINVAVVGVNHEADYVSYEGRRAFKHRLREWEPVTVASRLHDELAAVYDELLVLPFKAANQRPYPFRWLDPRAVSLDYGSALTRIGNIYQRRFH